MAAVDHLPPAWRGSILTVDDCPTTRAWMAAVLEARGWRVQAVDNGADALEAARSTHFDAIVLDVEMPGIDGLALGRALRGDPRTARTCIAMHSGLDEAQVRAGFCQYDAFVPKSGQPLALGERVEQMLRAAAEATAA